VQFPCLSVMATDYLSIPAMTAETERQFNSCGTMLSPLRNRLDRYMVGYAQSLRSWHKEGIINTAAELSILGTIGHMADEVTM
jgi:hypothetical protein